VVLTLDRHGAMLLEQGRDAVHIPTIARTVYDVTGAGDMVLAALAAAVGNGAAWAEAVRFANAAAGLEVEVFGVEPIPLERIHHALLVDHGRLAGKSRELPEALVEIAAHRREGRSIVFTNGCFDLLHAGHIQLLRFAKSQGDVLVVGINDDASVRRLKGPERPVHTARDRAEILGELASVDIVVVFAEDTPERLLEAIRPDVLVKGGDYSIDRVVGRELVESYGGRIALAPMLEGRSTTNAIGRIRTAQPARA
jgi:D-beta-D-heptose 7-phosphate kinase/D-beta-D-heptose 1-phosphate adenosyltransferase